MFNRSLFIKYYKKGHSRDKVEFQGFDGAVEGDYDDGGQGGDLMDDLGGGGDIDVNFEEGTM